MVVEYPSRSEGGVCALFTVLPWVVLSRRGSVVPYLVPQVLLGAAVSFVAYYLHINDAFVVSDAANKAFNAIGLLLAVLLVFKTQVAYNQFWTATEHVDGILQGLRTVVQTVSTVVDLALVSGDTVARQDARRIVRHLALYYYVIIEYFQRSGVDATENRVMQDRMRFDIRQLAGPSEFKILYQQDVQANGSEITGSRSQHAHTNPSIVMFWIYTSLGRIVRAGACPPPVVNGLLVQLNDMMGDFWAMNKIEHIQFPLPYEQSVKFLLLIFVFGLPFIVVSGTGRFTPVFVAFVVVCFFGIDEVAGRLDSPFGNDENSIDLIGFGRTLLEDLTHIYQDKAVDLDSVFTDKDDVNLMQVLEADKISQSQQSNCSSRAKFAKVHPSDVPIPVS